MHKACMSRRLPKVISSPMTTPSRNGSIGGLVTYEMDDGMQSECDAMHW